MTPLATEDWHHYVWEKVSINTYIWSMKDKPEHDMLVLFQIQVKEFKHDNIIIAQFVIQANCN